MKQTKVFLLSAVVVELVKFAFLYFWISSVSISMLSGPGHNLAFFLTAAPQLLFAAGFLLMAFFPKDYGSLKKLFMPFKLALVIAAALLALLQILGSGLPLSDPRSWIPSLLLLMIVLADSATILILRASIFDEKTPAAQDDDTNGEAP